LFLYWLPCSLDDLKIILDFLRSENLEYFRTVNVPDFNICAVHCACSINLFQKNILFLVEIIIIWKPLICFATFLQIFCKIVQKNSMICHLKYYNVTLISFFECQEGIMDSILNASVRIVSFFKESLGVFIILSDCCSFPSIIGTRWIKLI